MGIQLALAGAVEVEKARATVTGGGGGAAKLGDDSGRGGTSGALAFGDPGADGRLQLSDDVLLSCESWLSIGGLR